MTILGLLEAVDLLMVGNFQPQRSIYLAFGQDEDGGWQGAKEIAQSLKSRGVQLEFVTDEGGFLLSVSA
jgi:carboxypeptidase PM20D1